MRFWKSIGSSATFDKVIAAVVMLSVLMATTIVNAESLPQGYSLEYEGKQGIWFSLETHRLILADVSQLPALKQRVSLLDRKLALEGAQIADLRLSVELAVQSRDQAVEVVEAAVRGRREAEESRDAWHRSRVLWFGLGFVAAVAMTYGAVRLMEARK